MDPATLIGLLLVLIGVFVGSMLKGVSPVAFFAVPAAFLIVFLPTFGAAFLGSTMEDIKNFPKLAKTFIRKPKKEDPDELIGQIISLGERARRDGLLSLEDEVGNIEEPFLRRGLQLAIDGADPETVEEIMDTEIRSMQARHRQGAKLISSMGIYAPTFGIIGAVVGLIVTLGKLDNPEELGHGIAAAFIATFWGVFAANGIFLPWASKLTRLSQAEVARKRLVVEGVLAIQAGSNPRVLDDLMRSHLPPSQRASNASNPAAKKSA
jgi:chemotaxis protein MotA